MSHRPRWDAEPARLDYTEEEELGINLLRRETRREQLRASAASMISRWWRAVRRDRILSVEDSIGPKASNEALKARFREAAQDVAVAVDELRARGVKVGRHRSKLVHKQRSGYQDQWALANLMQTSGQTLTAQNTHAQPRSYRTITTDTRNSQSRSKGTSSPGDHREPAAHACGGGVGWADTGKPPTPTRRASPGDMLRACICLSPIGR